MFDVPLPMRRAQKDASMASEDSLNEGTATPPGTMAFSLMTKKGTRQQVSWDRGIFPPPSLADLTVDTHYRNAVGLTVCHCNEESTGSGPS